MAKLKMKLDTPQILFTSFFVATVLTLSNSIVDWDKRIYAGIFAYIITIIGAVVSINIFKDKD